LVFKVILSETKNLLLPYEIESIVWEWPTGVVRVRTTPAFRYGDGV